eukprot:TRINITY_DN3166_c0_g1_i1.p1 TRINITY_DN3166_c0_g1~~TRINITY_DN3166_c0_g1_i1.p1  ORF type:complete len:164 (+),score=28.28 TRINITY_DN3166_c0_g1_i1:70-561(+)
MTVDNTAHLINNDEKTATGVPMYAAPNQQPMYAPPPMQQTVVVVNESDDFVPACLGTACCGLIGLCFFGCMCNTPTGRVGASTGCIFYGAIAFVAYLTLLILFKTEDCEDSSASGVLCDTTFGGLGRLIANVVVAAVIVIVAVVLRIKYVKELQQPPVVHVAL